MIPAPPLSELTIGPVTVHAYAMSILIGIAVAHLLTSARLRKAGEDTTTLSTITMNAVIAGVVGARLYHVATGWERYADNPITVLAINNGGLSIWGAIPAGAAAAAATIVVLRRRGRSVPSPVTLLAAAVPGVAAAQAIGRLGNWFNQELYGKPSSLPWALQVDPEYRLMDAATYHPVFAYELLWMTLGAFVLWRIADDRRRIASYIMWYCAGRYVLELLRIDPSAELAGLRWNGWVALVGMVISAGWVVATLGSVKLRRASTVFGATVLIDQGTKAAAIALLDDGPIPSREASLRLELLTNPGAAFSFAPGFTWLYATAAMVVLLLALVRRHQLVQSFRPALVGLFVGGVAGNLIDRLLRPPHLLHGEVIDFFVVGSFPVFNVADAAVCIAALLTLLDSFRSNERAVR